VYLQVTTLRSAICYIGELQKLLIDYDAGMLDPSKYRDENQPDNGGGRQMTTATKGRRHPEGKSRRHPQLSSSTGGGKLNRLPPGNGKTAGGPRRRKQQQQQHPGAPNRVMKQRRVVLRPKWTDYSGSVLMTGNSGGADYGTGHQPMDHSGMAASFSSSSSSSASSSPSSYLVSAVPSSGTSAAYMPVALPPSPPAAGSLCLLSSPASPRDVNVISLYISLIDNSRD
jgi:hypothetical protein